MNAANLTAPASYVLGMPEDDYHSQSAVSASGLKVMLKSPKHFQQSRRVRVEKPEFDVGHAIHARILGVGMEVELIPDSLLSADGGVRSNAAKEFVAQVRAAGRVPLKSLVHAKVIRASEAVLKHPKAGPILAHEGDSEVSMFATDPSLGLRLRGRIDRVYIDPITGEVCIVDVKTAHDLSVRAITRAVVDLSYDLSMEMYRFLYELTKGVVPGPTTLIFTEKEPPYDVRVVRLGDKWIEGGWRRLRQAMEMYRDCEHEGLWPGVDDTGPVMELDAPPWYSAQAELEVGS